MLHSIFRDNVLQKIQVFCSALQVFFFNDFLWISILRCFCLSVFNEPN